MFNQLKIIKLESIERKEFNFSKSNIKLGFTLRIDIKQELSIFLELLKVAVENVEKELKL